MSTNSQHQVELTELLFGMSWEDPASDRRAMAVQPGDILTTVTSGGCNTLTLLLEDPARIYAVDINSSQSHLLELKCAAVRHLTYDELRAFLGVTPSGERLTTFSRLRSDLSATALSFWDSKPELIRQGVIYQGRYELFIRQFSRLLALAQGADRIEGLLRCETIKQQQQYFDKVWNTVQWRMLFKLAFNKWVLARRGLAADYFKFDDGSQSFAESFFRRTAHAIRDIPIQSNYFVAQYLLGRYWRDDAVPAYLLKDTLPVIRNRLDRITIVTSDAQGWLRRQPARSIDAFSLSNICELMSPAETARLFEEVVRVGRADARICFRNLIVARGVPDDLHDRIELQSDLSRELFLQDRSFVYSRVQALVVKH